MNAHMTNPFRTWWDLGYTSIIPIVPPGAPLFERSVLQAKLDAGKDERGKVPGIQGHDGRWMGLKNWQTRTTTEADLDAWFAMGAGVGLVDDGGLCLLDIDATDEATANAIEAAAITALGPAPLRVGSWPKRALVYRTDEALSFRCVTFKGPAGENRIEVLAKPKQMVVHGVHPKTGKPYEWRRPIIRRNELTLITTATLDGFLDDMREMLPEAERQSSLLPSARAEVPQDALRANDIEHVRKAVAAIPNTREHFPNYEDMIRVGEAIAAATIDYPEAGYDIFDEWSSRWEGDGYTPDLSRARWASFKPPHQIGMGWLATTALKLGGSAGETAFASRFFDASVNEAPLFPENLPSHFSTEETGKRFAFTSITDAAHSALTAGAKPLVKGLLDQGAMTVLYGESNSGKTFVAMDLAFHIAAGRSWAGMKVAPGGVVYVAAEGGAGARKRAAALLAKYGGDDVPFRFLLSPVNLLRADADLQPLGDSINEVGGTTLVVIDTLSRAMAGGDENASTDMGAMVRNLDALRAGVGAHLLVVHHSGKDKARGARGHSLLRAATDTEIEIADRVISVTKQRDIDGSFSSAFDLDVVTLGADSEGDPVTSCTVRLLSRAEAVAGGEPTPREAMVLSALDAIGVDADDEGKGVSLGELVAETAATGSPMSLDTVKHNVKELVRKRILTRKGRGRYVRYGQDVGSNREEMASSRLVGGQSVFD